VAVPTKADLAKREKLLQGFLKLVDETGRSSEKRNVAMIRGAIRLTWMKSPVKLSLLYKRAIPDMNPNTRTKYLYKCEQCDKLFPQNQVEIDHRHGNHTFTSVAQFESYYSNILDVCWDDLQLLCIPCHQTKTLMESHGLTFKEAQLEKRVIAACKGTAAVVKKWMIQRGMTPASTAPNRRLQIKDYLAENLKEKV
jgi:hypothetical protein